MMAGRVFLVLTGACQFGHGVGGFTTNFFHSYISCSREKSYYETTVACPGLLASHFRARMDLPKKTKSHLESGLNQRDRATGGFVEFTPTGSQAKKSTSGALHSTKRSSRTATLHVPLRGNVATSRRPLSGDRAAVLCFAAAPRAWIGRERHLDLCAASPNSAVLAELEVCLLAGLLVARESTKTSGVWPYR